MEQILKWLLTVSGGVIAFLFGAWSTMLNILVALMVIDYLSGMAAASINGELKSRVGLVGIARKVFIFAMVAVSHLVDILLIENKIEVGYLAMSVVITAYCINEVLSIVENAGKMGVYVPEPLTKAIAILRSKPQKEEVKPGVTSTLEVPAVVTPAPPIVTPEVKKEEKEEIK
ncbi:phage holin family protein [Priestia megaterium]|uniref:phage holin family protein n=1 Tax=Priestia megaterium TaxID=1404 RepID=UPI00196ABC75|nr:phage holin family protein [Priestia megaterium]QSF32766.1 phage holin family protein [Priestia megaterium]